MLIIAAIALGCLTIWTLVPIVVNMRWQQIVAVTSMLLGGCLAYAARNSHENVGIIGVAAALLGLIGLILIPAKMK